jgi:hypothetical protein
MVVVYKTEPLTLQKEVIQQAQPPHWKPPIVIATRYHAMNKIQQTFQQFLSKVAKVYYDLSL